MVKLIATSDIGKLFDTGPLNDFLDSQTNPHQQLLSWLDGYDSLTTWTPVSISSTQIVVDGVIPFFGAYYTVTVSGSGISPISSANDFLAAVSAGLANGDFSSITVLGGQTSPATTEILSIALSATGYTMTSGSQVINVNGSLPTSLSQFNALSQIADQMAIFDTLTTAEQSQIITDLNAYGITDFSVSSGGIEVFSIATTATEASMTVMGYKIALIGSFSSGFGDALALLAEVSSALQTGAVVDFSNIAGTSVTKLKVFNPAGDVILKTVGDLGTSDTIALDIAKIDGKVVGNLIVGSNDDTTPFDPYWSDILNGTDAGDHMFGLAGNDILNGGKGNDFLFGGTGNDNLNGGNGNDVLNPGSNFGYDGVIGSKGDDTIILSDNGEGYSEVNYSAFARGIKAVIKGLGNTGTIFKGKFGTDTIIDVKVPMKAGWVYTTGGFGVVGSAKNDKFNMTTAKESWMQARGGDGVDSYVFKLSQDSIIRLAMSDATNGVDIDLSAGLINDDGFGNAETIKVVDNGGQLEVYASRFDDTIVGSNLDERFILHQGNDTLDGGGGTDLVRYDRGGVEAVNVNLTTGIATGTWYGQAFTDSLNNIEDIRGSRNAADTLTGDAQANNIKGRGGDDFLFGKTGNDVLQGDDGNDKISGGKGKDTVIGGNGDDILTGGNAGDAFVFNAALDEGRDKITDFQDGIDRIQIEGASFADLTIQKHGGGSSTKIILDSGTEIIVQNIIKADIDIGDFVFV
jgi:Ca2+-binding RTX toxin-like protein